MPRIWFLYASELVTGPFTTDQVESKLEDGSFPFDGFVWWKGQPEWVAVATWQENLPQILASYDESQRKSIWYIEADGSNIGPLTQTEMIKHLNAQTDLSKLKLWATGMPGWRRVFELHSVMEQLGLSRREHERAPLMGTIALTRSNDDPRGYVLKPASISVGGLGVNGEHDLRKGDQVSMLIKSPDLPGNLHLRGIVTYVNSRNFAGIRFERVHPETAVIIQEYVRRFSNTSGSRAA
jgi:hypothetical protein